MNTATSTDTGGQNDRREIETLRATNRMLWSLLADILKKMQVSSTAIKASVSSLLGYDIVLGASAQHELLEVIENSSDQVSKSIILLTFLSQMESDSFMVNPDPIEVSEVLAAVTGTIARNNPDLSLDLGIDKAGKLICMDYDYLSIALVMLCELITATQLSSIPLKIRADEVDGFWRVDIGVADQVVSDVLVNVLANGPDALLEQSQLLPTRKLQFYVVFKIFERLSIQVGPWVESGVDDSTSIRLIIPAAETSEDTLYCE